MAADPVVSPADTPDELAVKIRRAIGSPKYRENSAALVALDALLAVGERDKAEISKWQKRAWERATAMEVQGERDRQHIARLTERLEPLQQRVLAMIERNGFVFRTPLDKPDTERTEAERWEKLAFTLYTEICETDSIVRAVLADKEDADAHS